MLVPGRLTGSTSRLLVAGSRVPVLDGARADARRRMGATAFGLADRDPGQRENDNCYPRHP